jgi:hypothetical protein
MEKFIEIASGLPGFKYVKKDGKDILPSTSMSTTLPKHKSGGKL